jgi:hypothetical protein
LRISKEQYQEWLENPVTGTYHQYLLDIAAEARKQQNPDVIARSLDDLISLGSSIAEATTFAGVHEDLAELEYEDIENFYQSEKTNES